MYPVEGCTIPAAPPTPTVRCGSRGSAPPIGIRHRSTSWIFRTRISKCSSLRSSRSRSSSKPTAGRATSDVSSRKTSVGENGIAYRNVGIRWLRARISGWPTVWSSLQSMNSIESSAKGCASTVAAMP